MPREDVLIRIRRERDDRLGLAIAATIGLGAGVFAGMVVGEMFGKVNSERVLGAVGKLRPRSRRPVDPHVLERAVLEALRAAAATRDLELKVHALGDGLVEITGTAPDAASRIAAGITARTVLGADVVVNRVLIEGNDIPARKSVPPNA